MTAKKCDNCGCEAHITVRFDFRVWYCNNCGSSVRCVDGSDDPMGKMAPPDVRKLRRELHMQIDPLWEQDLMPRDHVYTILRSILNLSVDDGHIGMMNKEQLEFASNWFANYIETNMKFLVRRREKRNAKRAKRNARIADQDEY